MSRNIGTHPKDREDPDFAAIVQLQNSHVQQQQQQHMLIYPKKMEDPGLVNTVRPPNYQMQQPVYMSFHPKDMEDPDFVTIVRLQNYHT